MDSVFGYVTPDKGQLTEKEYESFRACYCGVCRAVGRSASQAARMGLSYDITFLAVVLSSVISADTELADGRCIAHPIKKRAYSANDPVLDYAASVGVLLEYLKLADDWHDERSIKALFEMAVLYKGYRRVKKRYGAQFTFIRERLDELSHLEGERCSSIDISADTFAGILELLFTPELVTDVSVRRSLAWFGYNLGRWIYIIDAYNDIDRDEKTGAYNPLLISGNADASSLELSLTLTLSNIASAFELIDFKKNKELIGKMVYIGLKEKQNSILHGNNDEKKGD